MDHQIAALDPDGDITSLGAKSIGHCRYHCCAGAVLGFTTRMNSVLVLSGK